MITVADKTFKTKIELLDFVRNILKKLGANTTIEKTNEYFDFFLELLNRHPEAKEKLSRGVSKFKTRVSVYKNLEICLVNDLGIETVFSYRYCIDKNGSSSRQNLIRAMRYAIEPQILNFKKTFEEDKNLFCNLCGSELVLDECHVDHEIPFSDLASTFLKNFDRLPELFLNCPKTNSPIFKSENRQFEDLWLKFHLEKAKLRLTHPSCNLRRTDT